ncbi:MAG TPA: S8 family serine peptidase, partial [Myxococcales bacterium]|nr:S8 family serine peptidase [Myxococcales bacterium]
RVEVESPPGSGKFQPAASAFVRTLQPRLRISFGPSRPAAFRVLLAGPAAGVLPRDVTPLFAALSSEGTAVAPVDVAAGTNTLLLLTGEEAALLQLGAGTRADGGTPDGGTAAGPRGVLGLALPAGVRAQAVTLVALTGKELSVAPREVLPLVYDPGAGTQVERDTVIIQMAPRTPLADISGLLRSQRLELAGMDLVTLTVRARITDGRSPSEVARTLRKLPRVKAAMPNPAAQPPALGERLPDRLRTTYLENAGDRCVAGHNNLHGCFDFDGPDPTNELRISRQHWLMGTFAAHRLVDAIVGANPAVRPAIAMVDSGLGNGTNTSDLPIDATGLYGFSFAPFAFDNAGNQTNVVGPIGIAQVADTSPGGHGSQVVAAAAGRGRLALGAGKDLRVRELRHSIPPVPPAAGVGGTWQDTADAARGACLDARVSVLVMEVWNAVFSYHAAGTPPNLAADLAAHAAGAPGIQAILQPSFNFCRRPFLDVGPDGAPATLDPGEGDGVYQVGEPFSDTDGDGRYDADRDGKILAMPLGNDGMNLDGLEMPSAFVPTGVRTPAALFAFGVSATETFDFVSNIREPERLASYSNFGPRVSVAATADQTIFPDPSGTLVPFGGTSAATPVAAGVIGEMVFLDRNQHAHPPLTPLQHIEIFEATAEEYGTTQLGNSVPKPNDHPGHPGEAPDQAFGYGRVNAWKALLSVANGGLARESHQVGGGGRPVQFPSVTTLTDADTRWYGFKVYGPVIGATVWLDGVQLQDPGAAAPGNGSITAYAGVRADRIVQLGIDMNNDGVLDEDPTRGIVPMGNEGGLYAATFSVERADLLGPGGKPRTLSLRKPGQTAADAPFFTLSLDLPVMREGRVPGVVFDDFVFEVTLPDFGDAPDQGGMTVARGSPLYPTSLASDGARHLDSSLEWFGQPDRPAEQAVSPEHDGAATPGRRLVDPDGVENTRPGLQGELPKSDLDRFDDGVLFFPLTYVPGQTGKVQFTVCVASRWQGRYTGQPSDVLYVNGWIDWNGVDGWQESGGEHVLDGVVVDPAVGNWMSAGAANVRFVSVSPSGRCGTLEATFPVPAMAKGPLRARFRLDYGENAGRPPPNPRIQSDRSLSLTRGAARFGEVEDSVIAGDFGDAPDPSYSTRTASGGARHLDFNREWLGKPGPSGKPSATRETDGCDLSAAEEDGVPNLGADCKGADQDSSDDGAVVPADATPGNDVPVEIDVSARVDGFGFANRGPAGETSAGVSTLAPDCTLKPIAAAAETPGL